MPYVRSIEVGKLEEIATHLEMISDLLMEEHIKPNFYQRDTIDHVINVEEREAQEEAWDEVASKCWDYAQFIKNELNYVPQPGGGL